MIRPLLFIPALFLVGCASHKPACTEDKIRTLVTPVRVGRSFKLKPSKVCVEDDHLVPLAPAEE